MTLENIGKELTTAQEAETCLWVLSQAEEQLYKLPSKPEDFIKKNLPWPLGSAILNFINDSKEKISRENFTVKLNKIRQHIETLGRIRIIVATPLSYAFTTKLVDKIELVAKKKLLLDLVVDNAILGGALFEYHGKIADLSLKNKIK